MVHDASELPDDVLSSILSRMTIKDAVKTSILSTRWRYLFASMPTLQFGLDMFGFTYSGLRGDASMPHIFGEFVVNLPAQVKSLIVTACYTQVTHFPTEIQIFRDLRMLALLFESTYDFDIVKISPVLDACPVLQYLDISQWETYRQNARGSHIRSSLSPTYHAKLKEVRFGGFHGTGEEIELAIYILRSAMVLEITSQQKLQFNLDMFGVNYSGVQRLLLNFSCGKIPTSKYINLHHNTFYEFPLELLSKASSLKSLSLSVCAVRPSVGLRLNSLKNLYLTSVLLKSGELEGILSSRVNPNQLVIKYCKLPHKLCISGYKSSWV
ncbi:hypothetical protein P3S67_025265 [Capsicum chacoense]